MNAPNSFKGLRERGFAERHLSASGTIARVEPDEFVSDAYVLSIAGAEQSHVNVANPLSIFYDYLQRIAAVVDAAAPVGRRLRVAHLGAGALTLARRMHFSHPGSEQWAVDWERELLDFVLDALPLPEGLTLKTIIADIADSVDELSEAGRFDVVVLDIFSGPFAPPQVSSRQFYATVRSLLTEDGVLIINIGDEPGLTLVRSQVTEVAAVFPNVFLTAEERMFTGRYPGNMILAARYSGEWTRRLSEDIVRQGPHPAKWLSGEDLTNWVNRF